MKSNDKNRYEDIICLPHHVSSTRPQMPIHDRAAQFSPFAALTGHGDAVLEAARLTEEYIEIDEYEKAKLDESLKYIQKHLDEKPEVTITYFIPDMKKTGGSYETVAGWVKKVDEYEKCIVLQDGTRIDIGKIQNLNYNK